jgi:hypothetical protein
MPSSNQHTQHYVCYERTAENLYFIIPARGGGQRASYIYYSIVHETAELFRMLECAPTFKAQNSAKMNV